MLASNYFKFRFVYWNAKKYFHSCSNWSFRSSQFGLSYAKIARSFGIFIGYLWWVYVCRSMFFSLTSKSPSSTVTLPRVSSILFNYVRKFILLEAVICRLSILPEKSLWSGSNTLPSTFRPEDALVDFMANSTLGITKFSIAVNIASWTLVSTDIITISASLRTLLTIFSSSVCTSICGWTWIGLFVLSCPKKYLYTSCYLYFQFAYLDCFARSENQRLFHLTSWKASCAAVYSFW